jgi:hypothetical protein
MCDFAVTGVRLFLIMETTYPTFLPAHWERGGCRLYWISEAPAMPGHQWAVGRVRGPLYIQLQLRQFFWNSIFLETYIDFFSQTCNVCKWYCIYGTQTKRLEGLIVQRQNVRERPWGTSSETKCLEGQNVRRDITTGDKKSRDTRSKDETSFSDIFNVYYTKSQTK